MKAASGLLVHLLFAASIVDVSYQLFCGNCPAFLRGACCAFSPPNCCPYKTGVCTTPIPDIPQPGIYAVLCSGDQSCSGFQKCCPITQASTGQYFSVCQNPGAGATNSATTTAPTTTTGG